MRLIIDASVAVKWFFRNHCDEVHVAQGLALLASELETFKSAEINALAVELASRLQHHLFDTLYHALALKVADAKLLTADKCYFDNASAVGSIVYLPDLRLPQLL